MLATKMAAKEKSTLHSKPENRKSMVEEVAPQIQLNPHWNNLATHVGAQSTAGALGDPSPIQRKLSRPIAPPVQRMCAECEEELSAEPETSVQTKLTVGAPNDPYEKEADAVADKVMRMPAVDAQEKSQEEASSIQRKSSFAVSPIQRLCAECKEELSSATPDVQSKSEVSNAQGGVPGSVKNAIDSPGEGSPLTESIRSRVEPTLGVDLSHVKVHSDLQSQRASKDIQAKAFTHKNNIFLGEGQSHRDVGLIAHEATHTVQQGVNSDSSNTLISHNTVSTIQRATDPEFRINGIYPNAGLYSRRIYFDFSSSNPNATERAKAVALAGNTTQDYDLRGYASEEGTDAVNFRLAQKRINKVSKIMRDEGHTGNRNEINDYALGANQIDYRNLRRVDVLNAGSASSMPNCEVTLLNPTPAVVACGPKFAAAHPIAMSLVMTAFIEMLLAPFNPAKRVWIDNVIATLFGNSSHYLTIFGHMSALIAQVADQVANHECHNACDAGCAATIAYMPGTTGLGSLLTLCSDFESKSNNSAAETLVHEALHVTPGLGTEDLAYGSERGIVFLQEAQALRNTDSYVALILELNNPGSIVSGVGSARDNIDPTITGAELGKLQRAMAYLEKWVIESTAETSSLYDTIVEVRGSSDWATVSYPYYKDSMTNIAPLFGLTMPPAIPSEADQVAIAGIYDRLMNMDNLLWESNLDIVRNNLAPIGFSSGPSAPLSVNAVFLAKGQTDMLTDLIVEIVEATPTISSAHRAKYVQLISGVAGHASMPSPSVPGSEYR